MASTTEAGIRSDIQDAEKCVSLIFNNAIEQLSRAEDAERRAAIVKVAKEAAASVKCLADIMVKRM